MSRSRRLPLAAPSLAVLLALGTPGAAQNLTSVESMDYTGILAGKNGGAGLPGVWSGSSFDSLVGWWPLDGNANDAGPLGLNATLMDGTFVLDTPPGLVSSTHSLEFASSPRTLFDLSNYSEIFGSMMRGSISLWAKTDTRGPVMTLFGASNTNSGDFLQIFTQGNNIKYLVKGGAPTGVVLVGNTNITNNVWHHIAVTVDETRMARVYVDGSLETSGQAGFFGHILGMNGAWVGRYRNTASFTRFFTGKIDDVAIWGNVLSLADIQALASNPPGLVAGPTANTGPAIGTGSLDSGAFQTFGLTPAGNRVSENNGAHALREISRTIDLGVNADSFVSFLMRRPGSGVGGAEIHFTDSITTRCRVGWNSSFQFIAGLEMLATGSIMQPDTTYFVVVKIDAGEPGPDQMFARMYAPTEAVDATEPTTSWTVTAMPESFNEVLTALWIKPELATSAIEIDEIRLGTTWESVTRAGYGQGCLGNAIGRSERPALNSSNYQVHLSGAEPGQSAFLTLGVSNQMWGTLPLPVDLGIIGAPGCSVLASREISIGAATNGSGAASSTLPIPDEPALLGQTLFAQWTSLAPNSPNTLKLAFSDGMEILIER